MRCGIFRTGTSWPDNRTATAQEEGFIFHRNPVFNFGCQYWASDDLHAGSPRKGANLLLAGRSGHGRTPSPSSPRRPNFSVAPSSSGREKNGSPCCRPERYENRCVRVHSDGCSRAARRDTPRRRREVPTVSCRQRARHDQFVGPGPCTCLGDEGSSSHANKDTDHVAPFIIPIPFCR